MVHGHYQSLTAICVIPGTALSLKFSTCSSFRIFYYTAHQGRSDVGGMSVYITASSRSAHIGPPFSCPAISYPTLSCPFSWGIVCSVNRFYILHFNVSKIGPSFSCAAFSVDLLNYLTELLPYFL